MTDLGPICDWPHDKVELACTQCDRHGIYKKRTLAKRYGVSCSMEKIADQLRYPCKREDCGVYFVDAERVVEGFTQPEGGKI